MPERISKPASARDDQVASIDDHQLSEVAGGVEDNNEAFLKATGYAPPSAERC
jgi:hypothetical protein